MITRILAIAAALGMIFGSTLTASDAGGEPVAEISKVENSISKEQAKKQANSPIRPKEVTHGSDNSTGGMVADSGTDAESDNGNSFGGTFENIGAIDTGGDGEPEQPSGGEEPDPVEDSGSAGEDGGGAYCGELVEPPVEDPAEEPSMEYLGEWTISFYCNCPACCGQWSGGATASGVMPSAWWTAATGDLPFGTILYVDGLGTFEVQDRGTGYGWLDVFVGDHGEALANGLQSRSVYVVR